MPPVSRKAKAKESDKNETPIHDQLKQDLVNASPEEVTQFQEDDDPLSNVGEIVDDPDGEEEAK